MRRYAFFLVCMVVASVPVSSPGQMITGQTRDVDSDTPVQGAAVVLQTPDGERVRVTETDSLGGYSFPDLSPARYVIKVRRVGYEQSEGGPFTLGSEDTVAVNLAVKPNPVAMEEVTVEAEVKERLQRIGFYERKKHRSGSFLDRAEIKSKNASVPSELFQSIQGMNMQGQVAVGMKPFLTTPGRSTIRGRTNPCVPTIVVDGIITREGQIIDPARTRRLDDIVSVSEIQALEVYPRSSTAPAEYGGTSSPCGVVVIWTGRDS